MKVKHKDNNEQAIWERWQTYPEMHKKTVLQEFRRKLPDEYYNKEQLIQFLREKFTASGSTGR